MCRNRIFCPKYISGFTIESFYRSRHCVFLCNFVLFSIFLDLYFFFFRKNDAINRMINGMTNGVIDGQNFWRFWKLCRVSLIVDRSIRRENYHVSAWLYIKLH